MQKKLDKWEVKDELQNEKNLNFNFKYKDFIANSNMIDIKDIAFGYNNEYLFKKLSFRVEKGDKICVIGKNGKGKSTLLKILVGLLKGDGEIWYNPKTEIGYFGQMNVENFNLNNSIEQELQEVDTTIPRGNILSVAGKMLFSGNDAQKKIKVLSGGEKSRVALGKILLKPCNLLVLDEPTNHLDLESCESLMDAINEFDGASIIVSHNEFLINNIANRLIIFDNGKVFLFEGNYQLFLEKIGWKDNQ
jgi:ATP-binding cassette subfamily F protein 3